MSIGAQMVAIVAGGPSPLIATAGLAWSVGELPRSEVSYASATVQAVAALAVADAGVGDSFASLLLAPETPGCQFGGDDVAAHDLRRTRLASGSGGAAD